MNKIRSDQNNELVKIPDDLINEARHLEEVEDENLPRNQKVIEILENDYYCFIITGFSIEDLTILIEQSEGVFCTRGRGINKHFGPGHDIGGGMVPMGGPMGNDQKSKKLHETYRCQEHHQRI